MTPDPRKTYAYRIARRKFLDDHASRSGLCDSCRAPMDYSGTGKPHRRTATIEHRIPVEHQPDLALAVEHWAAWCLSCNSRGNRNKGSQSRPVPPPTPSRVW